MEKYKEIERSIIKKFRKEIWSKFIKAIRKYKLINDGDKIMVCISGSKSSYLMAKCIQELKRHSVINFDVYYVVINPGYSDYNLELILDNAMILNVPVKVLNSDIFDVLGDIDKNACHLCIKMQREFLYNKANELGCNKIAIAHHFNDVIEIASLSIFYGFKATTMMSKHHNVELIRPLCLVKEDSIISWCKYNNLNFINFSCYFTERCRLYEMSSERNEIKKLLKELKMVNDDVEYNIFKAVDNINCDFVKETKINEKYVDLMINKKNQV